MRLNNISVLKTWSRLTMWQTWCLRSLPSAIIQAPCWTQNSTGIVILSFTYIQLQATINFMRSLSASSLSSLLNLLSRMSRLTYMATPTPTLKSPKGISLHAPYSNRFSPQTHSSTLVLVVLGRGLIDFLLNQIMLLGFWLRNKLYGLSVWIHAMFCYKHSMQVLQRASIIVSALTPVYLCYPG